MATSISSAEVKDYIEKLSYSPRPSRWVHQAFGHSGGLFKTMSLGGLPRKSRTYIYTDEFRDYTWFEESEMDQTVHTFVTPDYPAANVFIKKETINSRDPRNTNPQAGKMTVYRILVNSKMLKKNYQTLPTAKLQAEILHKKAVQKEIAKEKELARQKEEEVRKQQAKIPNFGRF